jgi:molybdopterin synthase catalytic subunit
MTPPPPTERLIDIRLLDAPVDAVPFAPFPAAAGGECIFLGRTRGDTHPDHGPLVRLSYDAYRPMALRVLESLARAAAERHGCRAIRVHHAVGDVPLGAASVLVQVACDHRAEAFAACRMVIDRLKAEAPIWKREEWADGATWSEGAPVTGAGGAEASA